MKRNFSILLMSFALVLGSCEGDLLPAIEQEVQQGGIPPSFCTTYEVELTIDTPPNVFNVFVNNQQVHGMFQACPGDTLSIALSQEFQQDQQNYSQWSISLHKEGEIILSTAGTGQATSQLLILQ